ncbi:hypothetical protein GOBAR_AA13523 [Gossypium barbadense]|uniref:Uncharacterized protein n=1 Tax=Gossypium barbadense TaxID=3634 RepID=A0A2P5XUV3_GOSBA|nr:hypothetical protein GOBAR_AA13523 [Gossypium barbadense]
MLDLTEIPKLDLASSNEISTQKISVSDHIGGFQYTVDKHDSFVIDMDSFSYGGLNKGINQNPVSLLSLFFLGKFPKSCNISSSKCGLFFVSNSLFCSNYNVVYCNAKCVVALKMKVKSLQVFFSFSSYESDIEMCFNSILSN